MNNSSLSVGVFSDDLFSISSLVFFASYASQVDQRLTLVAVSALDKFRLRKNVFEYQHSYEAPAKERQFASCIPF
jgi:hypothetical protein